MKTKFVEVTDETSFNWGKMLVGRFDQDEWHRRSEMMFATDGSETSLLGTRGWSREHIIVLDLETGEGCIFRPGGLASADLTKHRVWVCPMFEPFLGWLYKQDLSDLEKIPSKVNLGKVPTAMAGYRRPGVQGFVEAYAVLCRDYGLRLDHYGPRKREKWVVKPLDEDHLKKVLDPMIDERLSRGV